MNKDILTDTDYQHSSCTTLKVCLSRGLVDSKDAEFCKSLTSQYDMKGHLSPKQWPWVEKMMIRALGMEEVEHEPPRFKVNSLKLFKMFKEVEGKIQHPSWLLALPMAGGHQEIKMWPYKGELSFGWAHSSGWLGAVKLNGDLVMSKYVKKADQKVIHELVTELCNDPFGTVAAHGKLMNKCCFCKKSLTDPNSVDHGYGPVCAKHWGLPW